MRHAKAALAALAVVVFLAGCGPRHTEGSALRACGKGNVSWVNTENPEAFACKGADVAFPNGASD